MLLHFLLNIHEPCLCFRDIGFNGSQPLFRALGLGFLALSRLGLAVLLSSEAVLLFSSSTILLYSLKVS